MRDRPSGGYASKTLLRGHVEPPAYICLHLPNELVPTCLSFIVASGPAPQVQL